MAAAVLSAGCIIVSCGRQASRQQTAEAGTDTATVQAQLDPAATTDTFISPDDFFTLDYTPYEPEPDVTEAKAKKRAAAGSTAAGSAGKKAGSTAKAQSVIPGLRKLDAYKTSYETRTAARPAVQMPAQAAGGSTKGGAFTVCDWGPRDMLPAEVHAPSFYVLFSEPVVPLAALGEPASTSPYMTITPALKGSFRWNGTSLLSFEASEPADPMQVYTITVSDNVTSISGKPIEGERRFSTTAQQLRIIWNQPGARVSRGVDSDNVPPLYAHDWRVQFNYPVKAEEIAKLSSINIEHGKNQSIPFTVVQELTDTVTYLIPSDLPPDERISLTVRQPVPGGSKLAAASFHTLRPFKFDSYWPGDTWNKYTNPVHIDFSQPVDAASVPGALSTTPAMPITADNIEVSGTTVKLYGLPVTFKSTYTIHIADTLKDIYGQKLVSAKQLKITVPDAASSVRFINSGAKMLEAQFTPKYIFEYQNILGGAYHIRPTTKPLADARNHYYGSDQSAKDYDVLNDPESTQLETEPENQRIFKVIDLQPYLNNGRGILRFDAKVTLPRTPTPWNPKKTYTVSNTTTIQVTDLGVTARFGANKIVAYVSSLSTGKPVEGAEVFACPYKEDEPVGRSLPIRAVTDSTGLAVINLTKQDLDTLYPKNSYHEILVAAHTAADTDDWAVFCPQSHHPWRSGVYTGSTKNAYKAIPRIFMFTDRGLYKPGETLSFRGIDRSQQLGSFIPWQGGYSMLLKSTRWDDSTIYWQTTGTASASGGFYGSVTLPETLEPGLYELHYKREGDPDEGKAYITLNVAFFERLKFQTGISMPAAPVIAGDRIQAELSASYLAGGALSGAAYESSWFREPWYFTTSNPSLKNYRFSPVNTSENRMHVRNDEGSLDTAGRAVLSCDTESAGIKGVPYRYRLSADITDTSNQQVSASSSIVVHPASFYIGVTAPEGVSSFPKTNKPLSFSYMLAVPDGTAVPELENARNALASLAGSGAKLTIKLSRSEWHMVQQQGVANNMYERYEQTFTDESESTVTLEPSGKFTVTALEPGYHTLTLSAKDSAGRDVITQYSFYATGSGKASWYQENSSSLRLTPDQSQYKPGETAHILMESTLPEGNYLITVEREGIFTEEIRHLDGNVHIIDIPIARNYVPVVYVSIASYSVRSGKPVHEYGTPDLDKPKGYYGVTPLYINPRVKTFTVTMDSPKQAYRPGEQAEITLTATKGGKPVEGAELTLMAVDRGVLDLINYHVPDPVSFFYNTDHFPLRVQGGDSRALLMDPVTYEVKNLAGGDAESEGSDKMQERKDFNPTAVFEPVLITGKDGKVTCRFTLPDSLTTYRLTAFGVQGELLALQEDEITVQNPINVQQVLPRRLRVRDTAEAGVLITNLDSLTHDVTVSLNIDSRPGITAAGGISSMPGKASVDGDSTHTVSVPAGQNAAVYFDVAAAAAGTVELQFTVRSSKVNEVIKCPLVIEKPYLFETVTTTGTVSDHESGATELAAIPSYSDQERSYLSVTLDATRLGLLGSAVQYVFDYPYGCMEQQSARVLPLVIFEPYIDVFNLDSKVSDIKQCVISHFAAWKSSQLADGAFGYWPSSVRSDIYVSTRIAHIWALALQRGYTKEELAIDGLALAGYLEQAMRNRNLSAYSKAYIQYVLALISRNSHINTAGSDSVLRTLYASPDSDAAVLALTGLAAVTRQGADSTLARQCADKLRTYLRPTARGVDLSQVNPSHAVYSWYNDSVEQLALILQLFVQLNKDDDMNTRLLFQLLQTQRTGYWKNTAVTARVLEAVYTLITCCNVDATDLTASALFDGSMVAQGTFKGAAARPLTNRLTMDSPVLTNKKKDTALPLEFRREGTGSLFYTAVMRYTVPEEMQAMRDQGLGITMTLYDNTTGEEIKPQKGSVVVQLQSGRTYRAKISLSSTYDREFIALRAPVPSGAEILDATFVTSSDAAQNASGRGNWSKDYDDEAGWYYGGSHLMSNQVIYDNEIQFFWDYFGKGRTTAEFKFRAVRRGVYPTPPVNGECMYEPEVFGRTGGILYTIK